ncbi:MAG: hypothetical protein J6Y07_01120 [Alphaproteobacteria bacterium]|nr:hypothetical protein [Alphaproteobacteria bacterium]
MSKKDIFNNAAHMLEQHKYYHGSNVEIKCDYLNPHEQFNSVQDGVVSGAFVTSDINHAKFFAISPCIAGRGQIKKDGNKIYLERLSDNIKTYFYIYTVYETPDNQFTHDKGTEYYSTKPIKISESEKCDTAKEIEKLGYEIYVLNEPLKAKMNKKSGNNFDVQAEMAAVIREKKYHRVDISNMIEQQSKRKTRTLLNSVFGRN